MKAAIVLLAVCLAVTPVLAQTTEARSGFLTEFDITFWQTLPFAALWSSLAAAQFGAVNWTGVMAFSVGASAANALVHAKRTTAARSL